MVHFCALPAQQTHNYAHNYAVAKIERKAYDAVGVADAHESEEWCGKKEKQRENVPSSFHQLELVPLEFFLQGLVFYAQRDRVHVTAL